MKVLVLSIVFNLLSFATALPTVPDLPKAIDLPGFAESLGFNSIEQVEQALSAIDDDGEPETRSLDERATGQCTLRRIKEVMFDFSKPLLGTRTPRHHSHTYRYNPVR